ncbi:hypothetical protein [Sphaerimonospora thailandensis]|uniref:Uncharacterized protein n=1 Tax=Sphaerimonospora thailandensis TaxID=795644 RepID=A0A8J3R9K5_9ACTN|nr:hypothetical protein [Sphaerimonospora thailandensis]GIH70281.1 hypothetical protein Mth01_25340 [Sphaerimonospora thailandensis]
MADTPTYQRDEILRIASEVRVVEVIEDPDHDGRELIGEVTTADGSKLYGTFYLDARDCTVTRVRPADGEPRPGQIWADRFGKEWFATSDGMTVSLRSGTNKWTSWETLHRGVEGPIVLVRDVPQVGGEGLPEGDWTWTEDDSARAVDPSGTVWDLNLHYVDGRGQRWHWAGGYSRETPDGTMQPLMSRDDYTQQDVPIGSIPGPLTPQGCESCQ